MPPIHAEWVLAVMAGVMALLGLRDVIEFRRLTPAAKGRFLIAIIFVLVLLWLAAHSPSAA
ncbi:MAG: hypothetical protein ACM3VZ_08975 [Acidobacteriota bacterium]